jgi:hypothetical protein
MYRNLHKTLSSTTAKPESRRWTNFNYLREAAGTNRAILCKYDERVCTHARSHMHIYILFMRGAGFAKHTSINLVCIHAQRTILHLRSASCEMHVAV